MSGAMARYMLRSFLVKTSVTMKGRLWRSKNGASNVPPVASARRSSGASVAPLTAYCDVCREERKREQARQRMAALRARRR